MGSSGSLARGVRDMPHRVAESVGSGTGGFTVACDLPRCARDMKPESSGRITFPRLVQLAKAVFRDSRARAYDQGKYPTNVGRILISRAWASPDS